jgi:glucose/mannose transport system substrate-binding protein
VPFPSNDVSTWTLASRLLLGVILCGLGCGASTGPKVMSADPAPDAEGHSTKPLVELFSWWTAPGEAEALQALVEAHKATHPEARLFNAAAASGESAKQVLRDRLAHGDPPDLLQENAHDLRVSASDGSVRLESLDHLFDALGLRRVIFPEVVNDVTVNGHIVAMPVNIHRENAFFYNARLLEKHHVAPPTTLPQLLDACRVLKRAGVTPIATAHQGWILRIMFNSIAMAEMGTSRYHDYFTGRGPQYAALLRSAIEVFKEILDNYTNSDAGEEGFGWTNAADAVHDGDAAMFLHGDWAKGYLMKLGWKPGTDFGVLGAPGAADLFLYGVDVFAIPEGAQNAAGARAFLETVASSEGQASFNALKGSSPIRADARVDLFDSLGQATIEDLRSARYRMLVRTRRTWDDAFGEFAKTRDVDALLRAFASNPPSN